MQYLPSRVLCLFLILWSVLDVLVTTHYWCFEITAQQILIKTVGNDRSNKQTNVKKTSFLMSGDFHGDSSIK